MKDLNERYWRLLVFTARKTRQHLSGTAFPPFSNIDLLRLLLSVCLGWYNPNKFGNKLSKLFRGYLDSAVIKARSTQFKAKEFTGCECFSSVYGVSFALCAWSLGCFSLVLLDWDEFWGGSRWLIKMYALCQEVWGSWDELFYYFPL